MMTRSAPLAGGSRMLAEAVIRNGASIADHTMRLQHMLRANEESTIRIHELVKSFRKDMEDTAVYLRVIEKNLAEARQRMPLRGVR
jgi:hypothetical protein